ncbi:MAG: anti-sigma factor, partial [Betaproteobacteria bacterium]|nr:anti-sigma factor [Betaproteobacteria bacterium]
MTHVPVTEAELHAYIDGLLPAERRAEVDTYLATHPE